LRKVAIIVVALAVVLAFILPLSHLHVYNKGVRVGYDEVAVAIGVSDKRNVIVGNVKVTSKGLYRKPKIARKFLACSTACHGMPRGVNYGG